jgi:hypothetical protein
MLKLFYHIQMLFAGVCERFGGILEKDAAGGKRCK